MKDFTTGTGQVIRTHSKEECEGSHCCIHNPSDHHMKEWKTHWREDRGLMERICKCGVGHPDPDHIERVRLLWGQEKANVDSIHGCCGCCRV